jgi:hypothetical protein
MTFLTTKKDITSNQKAPSTPKNEITISDPKKAEEPSQEQDDDLPF